MTFPGHDPRIAGPRSVSWGAAGTPSRDPSAVWPSCLGGRAWPAEHRSKGHGGDAQALRGFLPGEASRTRPGLSVSGSGAAPPCQQGVSGRLCESHHGHPCGTRGDSWDRGNTHVGLRTACGLCRPRGQGGRGGADTWCRHQATQSLPHPHPRPSPGSAAASARLLASVTTRRGQLRPHYGSPVAPTLDL